MNCKYRQEYLMKHRCLADKTDCSKTRLTLCRYGGLMLLGWLLFMVLFWLGASKVVNAKGSEIVVWGPADWREKKADCERRAKLLGGAWIVPVEDDRYCIVKK